MYENLKAFFHSTGPGSVLFTAIAFLFFGALLWHLTGVLNGAKEDQASRSANRLIAAIGALCGWIIGIAFAPFSDTEKSHFASIASTVSAFLSGYVVSKVDRFIEGVLFPIGDATRESWTRVGLFTGALLLAAITVFINRLYAFNVTTQTVIQSAAVSMPPASSAASAADVASLAARTAAAAAASAASRASVSDRQPK
jgi:hypothetical protein